MKIFSSRTRRPDYATPPRRETADEAGFDINQFTEPVDKWIGGHPAVCLGIALAVGVTIGCLVKRR